MDEKLEVQVYNNYRATLRSVIGGMAADRRQRARRATVDRYNVSYQEVKRIVAKFDEVNGITHLVPDLTLDQKNLLLLEQADAEFKANPAPCLCGSSDMVRVRVNPFEMEVNDRFSLLTSCFMCYMEIKEDI